MSRWQIFGIIVTAIVSLYKLVKEIVLFIVKRNGLMTEEQKRVRELIGIRYFEMMCAVKTARVQANKVDERNMSFLDDVNYSLKTVNRLLCNSVNIGSAIDLEMSEIRNAFSKKAANLVLSMTDKLDKLDEEWKEHELTHTICSGRVVELCDSVLGLWEELVCEMAKKSAMTPDELNQYFKEKLNGE